MEFARTTISGSKSILAFETKGGGSWEVWNRYISIEGKKAYEIGNVCGTCGFYFERMEGANRSVHASDAIGALNRGLSTIDETAVGTLKAIVPNGSYVVVLGAVRPVLCKPGDETDYFSHEQVDSWGIDGFWGFPHNPKTEYYRLNTQKVSSDATLFEFLVPMFPRTWLDDARVEEYRSRLRDGERPTVVSLSILDVKEPCDTPEGSNTETILSHWCLANYMIDGHHKAYAAALEQQPVTLLAFLATEQGVSSEDQIAQLTKSLSWA